jgi:hypothetical protein
MRADTVAPEAPPGTLLNTTPPAPVSSRPVGTLVTAPFGIELQGGDTESANAPPKLWWFAIEHALSFSSVPATAGGLGGGGGGDATTGVPIGGGGGEGEGGGASTPGGGDGDGGGGESTTPGGGGGLLTAEHAGPDKKYCSCEAHGVLP